MDHEWLVFFLIVLPLFSILASLAWVLLIFLHELGHAIPALIFTEAEVKIYIGHSRKEMDDAKAALTLHRLKIHFKPRLLYFSRGGYCRYVSENLSNNKNIIILFAGSVFELAVASIFCTWAFMYDAHGAVKLLSTIVWILALLSFFQSLYPRKNPIDRDEQQFYTDGYQLRNLFEKKSVNAEYNKAVALYGNHDFKAALIIFRKIIDQKYISFQLYELAISSLTQTGDFELALIFDAKFTELYADEFTSDNFCNSGFIKSNLGMIDESLPDYNRSLELNPENPYALNNRAFTYNLKNRYDESLTDLDKAISITDKIPDTYANRGLAKIKLGRADEGIKDIEYAILIDENNPYVYLNLGIYHFDQSNFAKALELFEKAKGLSNKTYGVDAHIAETKKMLAR